MNFPLFEVRGCSSSIKFVQMSEEEMNLLCDKSKDIFLNQPMLLELIAPIKICGNVTYNYPTINRLTSVDLRVNAIYFVDFTFSAHTEKTTKK
jgi:serine/threonine-protein phosphatase PP1 catalytic subunit